MKENANIDELLNSFIDGELTARQQTEVQRLITHDAQIAKRQAELQRCKMLVGSLPRAEAPVEMVEQIKTSLERKILLGTQSQHFDEHKGARGLLIRRVTAAAAMIGLVAGLLAVVYTILAPQNGTDRPIAIEDWQQPTDTTDRTSFVKHQPYPVRRDTGFNGRIELKTKTSVLVAVEASINRAIMDNGLSNYISSKSGDNRSIYAISCSREVLNSLLADLENIWTKFDSATLFVQTSQFGGEVVAVEGIGAEQIAEIVNENNLETRLKLAKDFAVLNNMAATLPGKELLAAVDNSGSDLTSQWRTPKPVLTSAVRRPVESEKMIIKPTGKAEKAPQVYLTIVVTGSE